MGEDYGHPDPERRRAQEPKVESEGTVETPQNLDDIEDFGLRRQAFDIGLTKMKEVLRGMNGYAVFAGGAMQIQGIQNEIKNFPEKPPGDLDVAVADTQTLFRIAERLTKHGAHIKGDKITTSTLDGAKILAGHFVIDIPGIDVPVEYPFEFFANTTLVPNDLIERAENDSGIRTLSLKDIKAQYSRNLSFETVVKNSTESKLEYINRQEFIDLETSALAGDVSKKKELGLILKDIGLSYKELKEVRGMVEAHKKENPDNYIDHALKNEEVVGLLSRGLKEKVEKRKANILEIKKLFHPEELNTGEINPVSPYSAEEGDAERIEPVPPYLEEEDEITRNSRSRSTCSEERWWRKR